jgi:hypothetical protein
VMFSAWLNIGAQKRPNHGTAAVIYRAAPSVEPFAQGATSKAGRDRSFKTRPRPSGLTPIVVKMGMRRSQRKRPTRSLR